MPIEIPISIATLIPKLGLGVLRMIPKSWTRKPRLKLAARVLKQHFDAIGWPSGRHTQWLSIMASIDVLAKLEDKKIRYSCPPVESGPEVWRAFLARFIDVARNGDVERAQAITSSAQWILRDVNAGFGAPGSPEDKTVARIIPEEPSSPSQRLSSTVEDRTTILVRVCAERGNEEIRLSVDKRPHPQNLQWTEGGKEFRTIAKGMFGVAQLCDVRFSGGDRPTFDLRYRTPGSDWISHHLQVDESGQVYRGIALVRVIVESLKFGTKVHELTFDATWFAQVYERDAPVESMLELYENGSQKPFLWGQAYTRGFWS